MNEDEVFTEKYNYVNFYEFVESIARSAEKLALMPIGIYDVNIFIFLLF